MMDSELTDDVIALGDTTDNDGFMVELLLAESDGLSVGTSLIQLNTSSILNDNKSIYTWSTACKRLQVAQPVQ